MDTDNSVVKATGKVGWELGGGGKMRTSVIVSPIKIKLKKKKNHLLLELKENFVKCYDKEGCFKSQ